VGELKGFRILQLIDGLKVGGAEVLLRDLVRGLRGAGYQVSVGYSSSGPIQESISAMGISLTRLPRLMRVDPLLLLGICRLIRRERPQIVHTHLFKSDFHGRLAARLCRVPVIVSTAHNVDAWARRCPLGYLYGLTARLADQVIAVSDEVRDYQIQYTKTAPAKIVTINNGVDVRAFENQIENGRVVRKELGLSESVPVIGIIGRLERQKDHNTFLEAAARIKRSLPEGRFLIVGDGSLREELVSRARALDLLPAVLFCGIRNDIPAVLAALDLLVFSSRWEGLPVTLLEGMAAGLPIVSTAVGGVPGVVVENKTALLVSQGSPEELAKACLALLKNKALAGQLGAAGRQRVLEKYSIQSMISCTIELYRKLWHSYVATANSARL
jgi:glycosyltransferase involved in cell wall biosynthesis